MQFKERIDTVELKGVRMKKILSMITAGLLCLLAACSDNAVIDTGSPHPRWQTIAADEAHRMMEESDSCILLDVRTEEEY